MGEKREAVVIVCETGGENPRPLKGSREFQNKSEYLKIRNLKTPLGVWGIWDENYY